MTYEKIGAVLAVILGLSFGLVSVGFFPGYAAKEFVVKVDLISIVAALILSHFAKDR